MSKFTEQQYSYVIWQNRATRFYFGARRLYHSDLHTPAAYFAVMSLELLMKASLLYSDPQFDPGSASHAIAKLTRMLNSRFRSKPKIEIPEYFYFEQRYLKVSRYPTGDKGVGIPASFLQDLDRAFVQIVSLVPFQYNTELRRAVNGGATGALYVLRRGNKSLAALRQVLEAAA